MSVHQHYLLSIQAGQDFLNLFLHFLIFFFQGIDPFIFSCIVCFDGLDFFCLVMDGLCHFGLADAVVCGAFANLEGDAGIEARVAVAKGNTHVDHGIGVRLVEGADSGCIGVMVMAIADGEACFISRVEFQRMEGCQSIAAGCGSVDVRIQTAVRVVHVAVNLLRIGSRHAVDIAHVGGAVGIAAQDDDVLLICRLYVLFVSRFQHKIQLNLAVYRRIYYGFTSEKLQVIVIIYSYASNYISIVPHLKSKNHIYFFRIIESPDFIKKRMPITL